MINKKIIAGFLSVCVVLSLLVFSPVYAKENEESYDLDLLKAIGIIKQDLNGNEIALRSHLAMYTLNLLGEDYVVSAYTGRYSDINKEDEYASAVETLSDLGYIAGYSDGTFLPSKPVTVNEVVKVLVEITGYGFKAKINGGYPLGYRLVANELRMLNGVIDDTEYVSINKLAKIINNTLDVHIIETNGITVGADGSSYDNMVATSGKTVLARNLKMYRKEGVFSGNEIINLTDVILGENEVVIDGIKLNSSQIYTDDFLGYNVKYIYKMEEANGVKELKHIMKSDNKETVLVGNHLVDVNGMELTYEEENEKERKLTISPLADIIYNTKKVTYDKKYFDNSDYSKITFIENNEDSKIDFIKIEVLNDIFIDKISADSKKIYDKQKISGVLDLDENNYDKVVILDENGLVVNFDSLVPETVFTYMKTDKYLKGYLSSKKASGVIRSVGKDNGTEIYNTDTETFLSTPNVTKSGDVLGKLVTIYLDAFGKAARVLESSTSLKEKVGFLFASKPEFDYAHDNYYFSIYTSDGQKMSFAAAERVWYNGTNIKKMNLPAVLTNTVILYELNENNEIVRLEQPVSNALHSEGRLRVSLPKSTAYHYRSNKSFGSMGLYDENTVFFSIDADEGETVTENDISIQDANLLDATENYVVEMYDTTRNGMPAKAAILYSSAVAGVTNGYNLLAVESFTQVFDGTDVKYILRGYNNGEFMEIPVDSDYINSIKSYNLKKGDVIRYGLSGKQELRYVEVFYRINGGWQMALDYYPDNSKIYSIPRINYGRAVAVTDTQLRFTLYSDYSSFSGFLSDCYTYPLSRYSAITVMIVSSGRAIIRGGTMSDIEPGDTIIHYTNQMAPYGFVVIKNK